MWESIGQVSKEESMRRFCVLLKENFPEYRKYVQNYIVKQKKKSNIQISIPTLYFCSDIEEFKAGDAYKFVIKAGERKNMTFDSPSDGILLFRKMERFFGELLVIFTILRLS